MRGERTEEQWKKGRKGFIEDIAGKWGLKSVVGGKEKGKGDDGETTHKKGEKSEMTRYVPHGNDRKWDAVGRRCKLVCVTARSLQGYLTGR